MKAQSLKSSNIAGKPGEARQKRDMTAETLSFEPVYADDCTLAPTISMARTMRFKQPGIAKGKQPTGTTVDASCGNPLCFATEHVMLRRWKSFGGIPQRRSIEEPAARRRGRFGCRPDGAVLDAVSAPRRHPHHALRNVGSGRALNDVKGLFRVCP
jgi:hypothetical protein